jgi:murein DD-endopeptidase MepM/ murein hydrolase activator NlpD
LNIKNLKKLKGFSIIIIPTGGKLETQSRQFSFGRALNIIAAYTFLIFFAGFFILNLTPLKSIIFSGSSGLNAEEWKLVNNLNQRLFFLSHELEKLKSTNQQLKDAVLLGDSTLIDSLNNANSKENHKINPYGGDIISIVRYFLFNDERYQSTSFHFSLPVNGFVSRGFNPEKGHMGIDFVLKNGTPIYAAASGYVIFADFTINDGYMIILGHPENYITIYKHCSELLIKARDIIFEGEIIALSGNTGESSTGPHLHFEIWKNGKPLDPKYFLLNNN